MENLTEMVKVTMNRSLKQAVMNRCKELNVRYSDYIRMLIILDIDSCRLKNIQYNEMILSDSIENIKAKLDNS